MSWMMLMSPRHARKPIIYDTFAANDDINAFPLPSTRAAARRKAIRGETIVCYLQRRTPPTLLEYRLYTCAHTTCTFP